MTNNHKESKEQAEADALRQESEERDRKRREGVEEALRRWARAPKKRPRFQR